MIRSSVTKKHRSENNIAQTLDRGLRILKILSNAPDGLNVTELAANLGIHRTIVYRLLATLSQHHLVFADPQGRYRLSSGLIELARGVYKNLQAVALPELSRLAEDVGATACLTVADRDEAVALLSVEPRHIPIRVAYQAGFRHPLHRGASGMAILAGRPPEAGERVEVSIARYKGYAVSRGELQPGACGIAAPIIMDGRADASICVVTLGDLDEAAIAPRVVETATRISASLRGS